MSDIELLFQQIKVSSCNCCTKAPEPKYHDMHCRFKLICELEKQSQLDLEQANKDKRELAEALKEAGDNFETDFDDIDDYQLGDWADKYGDLANKFLEDL